MKNKEQLAEEFSKNSSIYPSAEDDTYFGFIAGFLAKENIIKESLKTLEDLRDNINNSPPLEQMLKSRDLDRINNKIEILNSLL